MVQKASPHRKNLFINRTVISAEGPHEFSVGNDQAHKRQIIANQAKAPRTPRTLSQQSIGQNIFYRRINKRTRALSGVIRAFVSILINYILSLRAPACISSGNYATNTWDSKRLRVS